MSRSSTQSGGNSAQQAPDSPRPRGRPRDPALHRRILEAANEQFLAHGLEDTSLERIAQAAGTSRVTIYSYFGSKEALFNAIVFEPVREQVVVGMEALDPAQPREPLQKIAVRYLELVLEERLIAHARMLSAHTLREAGVGRSFYDSGPQRVEESLADYLRRVHAAGTLRIPDARWAAEQFLSMVRGNEQVRALMGKPPARTGKARRAYLDQTVAVFLKAYAP